ncbi:glycosyltransferase [Actinokineospora iranica]|uniref:Trehalose synthase n=1 Tax=Actinokineospora iranica TaxID=1271860 RepID=A0A1G6JUD4_9PSEU|nr:glycosyltransferase [Actinokineospora iranica]SDC22334.1 trehalose synthase [Actinokineospora iranica]
MSSARLREVPVGQYSLDGLRACLTGERADRLDATGARWAAAMPTVWHVNSTSDGGGVAEMLRPILGYGHALGIDVRWLVIEADTGFFTTTKRIDNGISGVAGDRGPLGVAQAEQFRRVSRDAAADLGRHVRPGDVVVLHDPQTAGLCEHVADLGAIPVWRAHNGADRPNEHTVRSSAFLAPFLRRARGLVTTQPHFRDVVLAGGGGVPSAAITPFIDPMSAKNNALSQSQARSLLAGWGLLAGTGARDPGRVPGLLVVREGAAPAPEVPMVVQVSRWDSVKDMAGVMDSFARTVAPATDAYLSLIGPQVDGVADDPEAAEYFRRCLEHWNRLPDPVRSRVQLCCLPTADSAANARVVNAAQRHAAVVTQKSRSEGFGLTVTEALWKARPVVATRVGGITTQIPDARYGRAVALPDPDDHFGLSITELITSPETSRAIGASARERIRAHFLPDSHFHAELRFLGELVGLAVPA